VIALQLDDIYP